MLCDRTRTAIRRAGRRGRGRDREPRPQERDHQVARALGVVHERPVPAVLEDLHARARERLALALGVLGRDEQILAAPDHERRAVVRAQRGGLLAPGVQVLGRRAVVAQGRAARGPVVVVVHAIHELLRQPPRRGRLEHLAEVLARGRGHLRLAGAGRGPRDRERVRDVVDEDAAGDQHRTGQSLGVLGRPLERPLPAEVVHHEDGPADAEPSQQPLDVARRAGRGLQLPRGLVGLAVAGHVERDAARVLARRGDQRVPVARRAGVTVHVDDRGLGARRAGLVVARLHAVHGDPPAAHPARQRRLADQHAVLGVGRRAGGAAVTLAVVRLRGGGLRQREGGEDRQGGGEARAARPLHSPNAAAPARAARHMRQRGRSRSRDGCTRFGSPGIFG
jgi:hypothetical protein